LGANILRTLQPTSCERNKELKFTVYPVSASWPESRQHMIIHATAVLMKDGVRWEPGDGKNEFQTRGAREEIFCTLSSAEAGSCNTTTFWDNAQTIPQCSKRG
jgi:hypothetical protein